MDPSLEIRKVPIASILELIQILDSGESWKKLMSNIPKNLESEKFIPKYGTHEMGLIESASKSRGSCTQILFDEWGTSGIKRPTLSHLLSLLIKSELYRAADFVSVKLLNGSPVKKPSVGPAAPVDISLDKLLLEQSIKNMRMDSLLNGMSYPNLESSNAMTTFNQNLDNKPTKVMEHNKFLNLPLSNSQNISKESSKSDISAATNSTHLSDNDMIKFSSGNISTSNNMANSIGIPAFSRLLSHESEQSLHQTVVSESDNSTVNSEMLQSKTVDLSTDSNIEAINNDIPDVFNVTDVQQNENASEPNIPHFSMIINNASEANIPNFSLLQGNSELISRNSNIPDFGALQTNQSYVSSAGSGSQYSSDSISSNIPNFACLQNANPNDTTNEITVNTTAPHFAYKNLQDATNDFEDRQIFNKSNKLVCGKIGDGGFGSVYLSRTLLDIPVAIKKLIIDYSLTDNNANEQILKKQFKVEIETLTKCKHENILILLGYSYDGLNHCLISEYMENGSLRDNLARKGNLSPDVRIEIAKGTAKGINYLHNGFETPLIHRDIKSANILLTSDYIPKICDFGLVKDKSSNHTIQTTKVVGTTAYMSPEAFRGDVSVKMDVFSFGVVLLELLTSLPSLDEDRIGKDIVTHVEDVCLDGSIDPLLDKTIGEWKCADQLYEITKLCLEEKRRRPIIQVVYEKLCSL